MKSEYNLLIQIDALLDTRYACLEKANPIWAESVVKNGYHKRITNNFRYLNNNIDMELVEKIWEKRDKEILKNSMPTEILHSLVEKGFKNIGVTPDDPEYLDIRAVLNVWPYQLTADEKNEFKQILEGYLQTKNVAVEYILPERITPHWLLENVNHFILHDINMWLPIHINALKHCRLKATVFTFPFVLMDEINPTGMNPIPMVEQLRMAFLDVIMADPVPLETMSFYVPKEKEKENE